MKKKIFFSLKSRNYFTFSVAVNFSRYFNMGPDDTSTVIDWTQKSSICWELQKYKKSEFSVVQGSFATLNYCKFLVIASL